MIDYESPRNRVRNKSSMEERRITETITINPLTRLEGTGR